jgi:hypothetical protein
MPCLQDALRGQKYSQQGFVIAPSNKRLKLAARVD